MSALDRLTPPQRTAALVGIPLVAGVVLYQSVRGRAPAAAPDPPVADFTTPSTDAIGTGELGNTLTGFTDILTDLTTRIYDLEHRPATTPGPTPVATGYPRPLKHDFIRDGESADNAASRLRAAGNKTYSGAPLTGAYIVALNRRYRYKGWDSGTASTRRWTGTSFVF